MEKRVYFVRHGQSVANRDGVLGGKDTVLSETGEEQAERVAERCEYIDFDTLIASDFVRAQQTAAPIAATKNLPIITNPLFGEFFEASEFNGLTEHDPAVVAYRKERNDNVVTNPAWSYGDGETVRAFMERLEAAKRCLEEIESPSVLVVSHAFFIQGFLSSILLNSFVPSYEWLHAIQTFEHSNTGVSMLRYSKGKWSVVMFNDHAHFAE